MNRDEERPEPDELLKLAQREEAAKERGKLTIYLGAAPGVGKTFAMLSDGRQLKKEGIDVVVGWAESHGRLETEALLEDMETVSPVSLRYRGFELKDFNLEAALERRPQLLLVDELPHTNAPGLRHLKRYEDIEEILDAGIDVATTMNVQHLESLNDVINQIVAIRVKETVPDTFVDKAEEIKLIDLPPEELIKRLHEGKVYVKDIVGIAVDKYFRPGNLLALRELALRLVAGNVDEKMRQYMREYAIAGIWPANERVLVAVYASPTAEKLVRSAYRLSSEIDAELIALHVETEKNKDFSEEEKNWLNNALDIAKRLGARIVWMKGADVASEVADYAQKNNVTKVVIGKPRRHKWWPSLSSNILIYTANIDVYLMDPGTGVPIPRRPGRSLASLTSYFFSLLGVAVVAMFAFLLRDVLNQVDLLFLLLLPPILSALYLGRGPSIASSVVSILTYDYLFVAPFYSFSISDLKFFLSFVIFFGTVVTISNLAVGRRGQLKLLEESESKSIALYGLSRDLINARNLEQAISILVRHTRQLFQCEMAVFMEQDGHLAVEAKSDGFDVDSSVFGVASWSLTNRKMAGRGTSTLPEAHALYIPMRYEEDVMGVMGISAAEKILSNPEQQVVLDTIASLGAVALERIARK
ncbi:MAG: DUF4118 domain-containing protein [Actinobacteria bacterium]|nr:DUF4118 domain-containing protein [Actinomycetota bacterium]MCL5882955.1 DUF4118 domain-containing protein [Actinomycetota bacterium]